MGWRRQMLILLAALVLVPFLALIVYYSQMVTETIGRHTLELSGSSVTQTAIALNDRLTFMENTLNSSVSNTTVLDMLMPTKYNDVLLSVDESVEVEAALKKHFDSVIYNNPFIKSIVVDLYPKPERNARVLYYGNGSATFFNEDISEHYTAYLRLQMKEFRKTGFYREAQELNGVPCWSSRLVEDDTNLYVAKQFSYFAFSEKLGIVLFAIDREMLGELCATGEGITHAIYDGQQELLGRPALPDVKQVVNERTLHNSWRYIHSISQDSLTREISAVTRNTYIIFIVCLLGTVAVLLRMVDGMEKLHKEKTLSAVSLHEAQLRALQYQINPHFLYNTLDVLSAMAATRSDRDATAICQHMSLLFRYNMSGEGITTLRQELESVEHYIYLQQIQFSRPFEVFFDVTEEAGHIRVIKFLLQPLVENAILHGFVQKDRVYCLEICALIKDKTLEIEIRDDGAGMSAERAEQLRSGGGLGIGTQNVIQRMRLAYGTEFGLDVVSAENEGTVILLRLPVDWKEERS